jgi:glutamate transport system permease protein
MSTVLFDTPGPRARARHRVLTVIAALVVLALIAWALVKLEEDGQFTAEVWEDMSQPNIWEAYWEGLLETLKAAAVAIVLSVVFGAVFAVARLSDHAWIRWPARVVVEFFRAIPLLLLIMFVYFGIFHEIFISLVVALMLYNGSVLAEVFRAGILAVAKGQSEAAYAVGMRKTQVMGLILLPQAVSFMLPAIISQCVIVLKDTALGEIISFFDLTAAAENIADFINAFFVPLVVAAIIYIVINYSLSRLAIYLEHRLSRRGAAVATEEAEAVALDTGA